MENVQQIDRTHRPPSNMDIAEYHIRATPNPLQEDPDVVDNIVYRVTPGPRISDEQLDTCARHVSLYYGVWSNLASATIGAWAIAGNKIRMSPSMLRRQSLPDGTNNVLITASTASGEQVGHAFVSQWMSSGDRVWWITQLLVVPTYRNKRRAMKILQTLALHYDIGRKSGIRDFVGIASSHPFTICAVLRVFGRGIEALPSRPDWERSPTAYPHAPGQRSTYAPLMQTSPVEYIHTAKLCPNTVTANTNFFVDHTVPDLALQRILFGMNKQVDEPWQWMFGELEEGFEYVCVLEYRYDAAYDTSPRSCVRSRASPVETSATKKEENALVDGISAPSPQSHHSNPLCQSVAAGTYSEIDLYLVAFPEACRVDLISPFQPHTTATDRSVTKCVLKAKQSLLQYGWTLPAAMNAKLVPAEIKEAYATRLLVPGYMSTWFDFLEYVRDAFVEDAFIVVRLMILQAVHFNGLVQRYKISHRDIGIIQGESHESGVKKKERLGKYIKASTGLYGKLQAMNGKPKPKEVAIQRQDDGRDPKMPVMGKVRRNALSRLWRPPAANVEGTTTRLQRATQVPSRIVDVKPSGNASPPTRTADIVEPQLMESTLRQPSSSPHLFFSDSDDTFNSTFSTRRFPKNCGSHLGKGRIG